MDVLQCQVGRSCSVVKICTFLNNYTVFEETNCIPTLRTNNPTKLQSLGEIDLVRFAAIFRICLINADIRSKRFAFLDNHCDLQCSTISISRNRQL